MKIQALFVTMVMFASFSCASKPVPTEQAPPVSVISSDELTAVVIKMGEAATRDGQKFDLPSNAAAMLRLQPFTRPYVYLTDQFPRKELEEDALMYGNLLDHFDTDLPVMTQNVASRDYIARCSDPELVISVRLLRMAVLHMTKAMRGQ